MLSFLRFQIHPFIAIAIGLRFRAIDGKGATADVQGEQAI